MKQLVKLYNTWIPAKKVFKKPALKCKFGRWLYALGLPVWRTSLVIHFGKYGQYDYPNGYYGSWAKHTYWKEDFLKTCTKFGRFWRKFIKPTYELPRFLAFYIFNYDLGCKTKYDDWCYEWNPQFTIVLFGLSLSIWSTSPVEDDMYCDNSSYWESILYYNETKSLEETIRRVGVWNSSKTGKYFGVRPEFLNKEYLEEYYSITSRIKEERGEIIA